MVKKSSDVNANDTPEKKFDESKFSLFDIGAKINFVQVFGSNPILWLLPICSNNVNHYENSIFNSGLSFEISSNVENEILK